MRTVRDGEIGGSNPLTPTIFLKGANKYLKENLLIEVFGKVQGVGFRYYVFTMANQLSIKGWVKNTPFGTVKIAAEGEKKNLQRFLSSIRLGSRYSMVENLEIIEKEFVNFKTFDIVY